MHTCMSQVCLLLFKNIVLKEFFSNLKNGEYRDGMKSIGDKIGMV